MLLRTLRFSDLPRWHDEPGYSFQVRGALERAYQSLHSAPSALEHYAAAVAAVEPLAHAPMSLRQRVRVYFVLGSAHAAVSDYASALSWLDRALMVAQELEDRGELLDLLYVHAATSRGALLYADVVPDARAYLNIIEGQHHNPDALDGPLTVHAVLQLAWAQFYLARYDAASQALELARQLSPLGPLDSSNRELGLATASLAWLEVQLLRWRGMPEIALRHAATAAAIYTEIAAPISAARTHVTMAQLLLDLAAQARDGPEQRLRAEVARPHVERAHLLASEAGDPIGQNMAQLVAARASRLEGRQEDRLRTIEQVIGAGQRFGDVALLAQAATALGDELAAQGRMDAALGRYRNVRVLLQGSDVPALGAWARRAEHRMTERTEAQDGGA